MIAQETINEIAAISNAIQAGLTIITKAPCTIDVVHFLDSGARFTFKVNSQAYPDTITGRVNLPRMIKALENHVNGGTATGIPAGRFVQVDSHTYHFWID